MITLSQRVSSCDVHSVILVYVHRDGSLVCLSFLLSITTTATGRVNGELGWWVRRRAVDRLGWRATGVSAMFGGGEAFLLFSFVRRMFTSGFPSCFHSSAKQSHWKWCPFANDIIFPSSLWSLSFCRSSSGSNDNYAFQKKNLKLVTDKERLSNWSQSKAFSDVFSTVCLYRVDDHKNGILYDPEGRSVEP